MLVPPTLLLRSLLAELGEHFSEDTAEASLGQSAVAALRLLEVRERGGVGLIRQRLERLRALLEALRAEPEIARRWPAALAALQAAAGQPEGTDSDALQAALDDVLARFETWAATAAAEPDVPHHARDVLAFTVASWEVADRRSLTDRAASAGDAAIDTRVTRERFELYLQARFDEPDLVVTEFRPLAGGFGKQTILLRVTGQKIDGPLVIRRDPGQPTVDNDCHRIRLEYPVIRAAFAHGFPAPDALWLDTEHTLLPGGDFIVMRMAPGRTGGNVFRSADALGEDLIDVLATGVARLHTLPPLLELGDLTNSIRTDIWRLSLQEATRRYIRDWRDLFLANSHKPSPALMALYGWLLDNVPSAADRPVLLHGDIGFHNMLIDEGRLSALVDWEFAHIGDPAEDMGSIRNVIGDAQWPEVAARYRAAGGPEIDPKRLHFFRVWQHVRNASASNLSMGKFQIGVIPDLKLAYTGHYHFPLFIEAACNLIKAGPEGEVQSIHY
jgi:aminoglycoside phosphotransferase (APT) family kinase protein